MMKKNGQSSFEMSIDFPTFSSIKEKKHSDDAVNPYSETEVLKRIGEYLREICSTQPFKIDNRFSDSFIALGGFASLIALYACLRPKFPEDSSTIFACIVAHFSCITLWSCIDFFFLSSTLFTFYSVENTCLAVGLSLERSSAMITLTLHELKLFQRNNLQRKHTCYLGDYFSETGYLNDEKVYNDFKKLYDDFLLTSGKQTFKQPEVLTASHTRAKRHRTKRS